MEKIKTFIDDDRIFRIKNINVVTQLILEIIFNYIFLSFHYDL